MSDWSALGEEIERAGHSTITVGSSNLHLEASRLFFSHPAAIGWGVEPHAGVGPVTCLDRRGEFEVLPLGWRAIRADVKQRRLLRRSLDRAFVHAEGGGITDDSPAVEGLAVEEAGLGSVIAEVAVIGLFWHGWHQSGIVSVFWAQFKSTF